jgi:hypothetical protein
MRSLAVVTFFLIRPSDKVGDHKTFSWPISIRMELIYRP